MKRTRQFDCFSLACLLVLWSPGLAHAQQTPPPIQLTVTFVTDDQHGNAALSLASGCVATGPVTCSSGSGFVQASLSGVLYAGGPQSIATVRLSVDALGNWTIAQNVSTPAATASCTAQTPCGGIAQASVGWSLQASSVSVIGQLLASGLQGNANADFVWEAQGTSIVGPFCMFVSPFNYGPQCPVPQPTGGLQNPTIVASTANANFSAAVTAPQSLIPTVGGVANVECQGGDACNAQAITTPGCGTASAASLPLNAAPAADVCICPDDIQIYSLQDEFNVAQTQWLLKGGTIGGGAIAVMQALPTSTDLHTSTLTEQLALNSNSCSLTQAQAATICGTGSGKAFHPDTPAEQVDIFSGTLFGNAATVTVDYQPPAGVPNTYPDFHFAFGSASTITPSGCQISCTQTYQCGTKTYGPFDIDYKFFTSKLQGVPVSRVHVSKTKP